MDVTAEAKQIMVQALSKMYSSRTQRGGLRLHRSLLLTLVMKSARDIYHSARLASEKNGQSDTDSVTENNTPPEESTPMDTSSTTAKPLREISAQSTKDEQRSGLEGHSNAHSTTGHAVDKENCSPTGPDRHSRKRRSKTGTEADFIPCKKAKLEFAEVKGILQNNSANCGRALDSLSLVPMPRTIVTF